MEEEVLLDAGMNVKSAETFREFSFPLEFKFKLGTMANDFVATDSTGKTLAYVRQKMFKLKEDIQVFTNESKSEVMYTIKADRVIDFNAAYAFTNAEGKVLGKVGRKGMKSLWKASYEIFNADGNPEYMIQEENPWAKVGDALLREIPLVGIFAGYMANPKYVAKQPDGTIVARLTKAPSFTGRTFKLDKLADWTAGDDERILLSFMMMNLLERRRG